VIAVAHEAIKSWDASLPPDGVTPELIRDVVTEVSQDQQVRRNITAMSPRVRNSGGAMAAADAMEEYLGGLA
jgi:UDP:flavonoid glycosyltransferase YjiC (YdhE family)